ncbi:effector binding domain-containing protein [Gracilibacillus sp. S3-1-1]|uniref:Effector binding domain-containing protein n=1 Tax=Gracilibacillus pellucidus TaxID=3095368 RepID=A0ACC6M609_9BACI|nr:effector binding domain-containing protein [Gracilibacillus sp. S3-1-1]MDX8046237.1 effector binding domain-containing protein [Gracilibacillus sp. S3-1-1]
MRIDLFTSIRTNNFNDEQMMEKIQDMWKQASTHFEGKKEIVYGVYYDYESDFTGDYSLGVGIENEEGSVVISNPTNYQIFKVDTSDDGIIKTWQKIWELEKSSELERSYTIDYEKYLPNGDVEIHIACSE